MASTLYRGGLVLDPDGSRSRAGAVPHTAVLVGPDGALRSGTDAQARSWVDQADRVVDLDGALVTPGFADHHVHLSATGALQRGVDLGRARSKVEALELVAAGARRNAGRPFAAVGWDDSDWPERQPFTSTELDRASFGGVVYAPRIDGHSAVVSSALAVAAGLPPGASVVRTEAHHAARAAFDSSVTDTQRRDDVESALRTAAAAGVVEVHEMGGPVVSSAADLRAVLTAEAKDVPRVVVAWGELVGSAQDARQVGHAYGTGLLGGDLNVDGSIGSRTARLRTAYADAPDRLGEAFLTAAEVRDHVVACTAASLRAGFHVIGEAGVDTVIAGFEAAAAVVGADAVRSARHQLEHLEMVDAEGAARLAGLGVVASVQPAFDGRWGGPGGMYAERLGGKRASRMNPFRTLLDAGVELRFGSDSPVTPIAPWEGIRAAVHHHDEAERITPAEAFRASAASNGAVVWDGWNGWADPVTGVLLTPPAAGPVPVAREVTRPGHVLHTTDRSSA